MYIIMWKCLSQPVSHCQISQNIFLTSLMCKCLSWLCWHLPWHSKKVAFMLHESCPNIYWFMFPQQLIENQRCGSPVKGTSCTMQVQNIFYHCLGAIASAFLKSTELHAVKDHCDGLYILGPGSGTIWRCGLVGIGVTWLEWVCYCGCGHKILTLVAWKSVFH